MKRTLWKRCVVLLAAAVLVSASGCAQANAGGTGERYDAPIVKDIGNETKAVIDK